MVSVMLNARHTGRKPIETMVCRSRIQYRRDECFYVAKVVKTFGRAA